MENLDVAHELAQNEERQYITGLKLAMVVSAVTRVYFLVLLDTSIIVNAIPVITTHFHSLEDLGSYGSSYQITRFLGFSFIFALGSLLCGLATSSKMLIVARAIAGLRSSSLMNGSLTIIASYVPLHKSLYVYLKFLLGIVFGPLLGGASTEYTTWRWFAILLIFIEIPEQTTKPSIKSTFDTIIHKLDLVGFRCGRHFILFPLWEHHQGDGAMIPLSMVRKTKVWPSCLVMVCAFAITLSPSYYLPVYFQSLCLCVLTVYLVGKLGYYLPWAVPCGILSPIGAGLLSTLTPDTPTGKWIGYQIILGAGRGPLIAVQNTLPQAQVSVAMSILMFSQALSGALFLTSTDDAPNANPQFTIAAGATGLRDVVKSQDLPGVLEAYAESVDHLFYMAAALGAVCLIFSFGMGWKDIRKKEPAPEQA
ncbi:major facilitator superfamily domain-containing protein [Aspergillus leporis]|uniref:Major facilitator superfamily domain-containing protein n=1 Tax=Aspergillus leporis TaxID=41062 RepID=A0A5N5WVQ9_9EURO|nr:major facilitator superfamily domain-containing protein [Aspergillus leporis]